MQRIPRKHTLNVYYLDEYIFSLEILVLDKFAANAGGTYPQCPWSILTFFPSVICCEPDVVDIYANSMQCGW